MEQLASQCYNWLELRIRQTDICNSICNKGNYICKHTQEHYSNWLHQHINATLTIFLPVYLYMMEVTREGFFPWLEWVEAACFYSGRNIKTEALGRSAGPVQNVIMALPNGHSWKAIREELKRCFSDQTSLGHEAA